MKINKQLILEYIDATRKNHDGMKLNIDKRLLKSSDNISVKNNSPIPAAAGIGALAATAYALT